MSETVSGQGVHSACFHPHNFAPTQLCALSCARSLSATPLSGCSDIASIDETCSRIGRAAWQKLSAAGVIGAVALDIPTQAVKRLAPSSVVSLSADFGIMEHAFLVGDLLRVLPSFLETEQEGEGVENELEPRHGFAAGVTSGAGCFGTTPFLIA